MATTQLSDIFVGDYYLNSEPWQTARKKTAVYGDRSIITRSPYWTQLRLAAKSTAEISYWPGS